MKLFILTCLVSLGCFVGCADDQADEETTTTVRVVHAVAGVEAGDVSVLGGSFLSGQ